MAFTSKNLHSHKSPLTFLKGATLFFLGMSVVMFMTQAFEIVPSVKNARQYIQEIIFTTDGYSSSDETVTIDGASGNAIFAGTVTGAVFCLEGDDCITERPEGGTVVGGESVWMTGSSNRVYYNSGNVGIGTDEPTEEFQVGNYFQIGKDGVAPLSTGGNFLRINYSYAPAISDPFGGDIPARHRNPNIQLNSKSLSEIPARTSNRKIENDNSLKFDYATGSYDYDTKLSLSSAGLMTLDGNIKLETGGYIRSASNANQLYLDNNGRVGIGTNDLTANNKLHVSTNVPEIMKITNTAASKSRGFAISGLGRFSIYEVDGVDNPERLSIASGGNVGIGTDAPSAKLHVAGTAKIGNALQLSSDDYNGTINAAENLYLQTHDTNRISILEVGNVGIGTDSPNTPLYVKGSDINIMTLESSSNKKRVFGILPNSRFGIMEGGNSERLTMLSGGNVGIGTVDPQTLLQVGSKTNVSDEDAKMLVNQGIGIFNSSSAMQSVINQDATTLKIQQNIYYDGGYSLFDTNKGGTLIGMSQNKIGFYYLPIGGGTSLIEIATITPENTVNNSSRLKVGGVQLGDSYFTNFGDDTYLPPEDGVACHYTEQGLLVYRKLNAGSEILICAYVGDNNYDWQLIKSF